MSDVEQREPVLDGGLVAMTAATARGVFVCPTCGADTLEAVSDGEVTNFLCRRCWDCWHVELGWVHRVDPETCPGCQHRDECRARRGTQV